VSTDVEIGAGVARPGLSRPRPDVRVAGSGVPVVVLLHGVGVGAETFGRMTRLLTEGGAVAVVDRAGYGRSAALAPATSLDEHLADLARVLERLPARRIVVGVSGGATLALALAVAVPESAERYVVHEPLVGSLAPSLHEGVGARLAALATTPGPVGAADFVHALLGDETWELLGERRRREVGERAATIRAEAPSFARFDPRPSELTAVADRVVSTLGDGSPPPRAEAAGALSEAGIRVVPLAGVRHLPQVEEPEVFAAAVRRVREELP